MAGYETFLDALQSALNHLNDPTFQPSAELNRMLGLPALSTDWSEVLRQAIERLKPNPNRPAAARSDRLYQVLTQRYVHSETQEAVAEKLHITARHLRREQNDAVQLLARLLWQAPAHPAPTPPTEPPPDGWSAQLRQELTALQKGAPTVTADVGETIQRVVELLAPVLHPSGVVLGMAGQPTGLAVAVQPTGLRQLLVRAITEWARHLAGGEIEISAAQARGQVQIWLTGSPAPIEHLPDDPLLQELLSQFDGGLTVEQRANQTHLTLGLDAAPPLRVLVVDDNEDLHHFYRRFVANTRYQIISLTDGENLLEKLEEVQPDAVVLDVMLPSVDGWELLAQSRQHPLGRRLPILVCSVIQEEALARALGATGYIRKPVGRSNLLQALNGALNPTRPLGSESGG